ncbi:MAG: ABC transporter permease [Candidatus Pacebacteria bacterium]|nr:ABC transporter permease [Candidatus Paceibacterota bacterium]
MIFTKIRRVVRSGFVNFWRNGFLSLSSILVLSIALLVFGGLIFFSTLSESFLNVVREKVDINVYFALNANEIDILDLKKTLEKMPEVSTTEYISREESLKRFKEKHQDNTLILQGLEEVGDNPLPAVLTIKAKDPSQYESITKSLADKTFIDDINYSRNKVIIDRLSRIIPLVEKTVSVIIMVLVVMAVIVTFNTIRVIIFSSRDEIAVMKLVGASNMYVRGPFVVSGVMYGIASAILAIIILGLFAYYMDALYIRFLHAYPGDISEIRHILFSYYVGNFRTIFSVIMGSGIILGAVSSYMAVRRYLNV